MRGDVYSFIISIYLYSHDRALLISDDWSSDWISPTIGLIVFTGILGASLARQQEFPHCHGYKAK